MKISDITPSNVRNFVEGQALYHLGQPDHIKEQAFMRSQLCKPCTDNGKCFRCGCKTPNMFYAPKKDGHHSTEHHEWKNSNLKNLEEVPDPQPCPWGPMVNKEEWEAWKVISELLLVAVHGEASYKGFIDHAERRLIQKMKQPLIDEIFYKRDFTGEEEEVGG